MTPLRLLVNAVVGGFLFFAWSALASLVLHLDQVGLERLAHEPQVQSALREHVAEAGLYAFPARALGAESEGEHLQRVRREPSGLLLVHPAGREPESSLGFLALYVADFILALVAGFLLWLAAPRVRTLPWRVVFVAALGGAGGLYTLLPLASEQGFPAAFLAGLLARDVLGFALVGLFLAWRMKNLVSLPRPTPRPR